MSFFKEKRLYRVEVVKKCCIMNTRQNIFSKGYLPSSESFKKGNFGFIPVGTKGWVMEKFGKQYFLPDENQEGLDLFMHSDQNNVLIYYSNIKEYCKAL